MNPIISCIIPTCDRPKYLLEAVNSVLAQTLPPREIIIVNNGREKISLPEDIFRKVTIKNADPYIGVSAARNYGAKLARGDYLAFLDDDDLWNEKYLENVSKEIERGELCLVSRLDKIAHGRISQYKNAENKLTIENLLTFNPGVNGSNIVIAKSLFWQAGGFDNKLPTSEDKSLIIELIKNKTKIKALPGNQSLLRFEPALKKLTGAESMARGVYLFTKKYKKLMSFKQYFYNWYKIYYYRRKAGVKSAILPYIFLTLFFAPKRLCLTK